MSTQDKALVDMIDRKPKTSQGGRQAVSLKSDTFQNIRQLTDNLRRDAGQMVSADDTIKLLYDFYQSHRACKKK